MPHFETYPCHPCPCSVATTSYAFQTSRLKASPDTHALRWLSIRSLRVKIYPNSQTPLDPLHLSRFNVGGSVQKPRPFRELLCYNVGLPLTWIKLAVPPVAISINGGPPTQLRCSKNGRTRNTRLAASTGPDFHNWGEIDVSKMMATTIENLFESNWDFQCKISDPNLKWKS